MANTTPVARVSAVEGQAFAKDKNGELRALHVGDLIYEGDVLVTGTGSHVDLAAADGHTVVLRESETLTVDAEVMAEVQPDVTDSAVKLGGNDINTVVKAINEGGSLDALLDETAAGDVGGGADGGPTFVRLLRITEGVGELGFEFDTAAYQSVLHDTLSSGGTDTASGTPEVTRFNDHAPEISAARTESLSEEGLAGGLKDTTGSPTDTTDAVTKSGKFEVNDADGDVLTVSLTAPTGNYTSNDLPITWAVSSNGHVLTGSVSDSNGVISPVVSVTIDDKGNYTATLSKSFDHSGINLEDVLSFNVGVEVSDGTNTASSSLTVNVEDDAPTTHAASQSVTLPYQDTNLLITLDVSGSMGDPSGVSSGGRTLTRLEVAQSAIKQLLDQYDSLGDVKVQLVLFSDSTSQRATWMTVAAAKTAVDLAVADGGTNYDYALSAAQTAFGTDGKITGAQNVSYFFSDGVPTLSSAPDGSNWWENDGSAYNPDKGDGIDKAEQASWEAFLKSNSIQSHAIGLGTGVAATYLQPIAYDGANQIETEALVVTDLNQLSTTLRDTIVAPSVGDLLTGGTLVTDVGMGADGGHLLTFTIDGTTYSYDIATHTGTVVSGTNHGVFDPTTHVWSVETVAGGHFVVDMDTTAYTYTAPIRSSAASESISYTVTDNDGDSSSSSLSIAVASASTHTMSAGGTYSGSEAGERIVGSTGADNIHGGGGNDYIFGREGNDVIYGDAGNDVLSGGTGNDTLSGGLGSDTFAWSLNDGGTKKSPAVDTITDFDSASRLQGGDVLDLRDLLQNESHTAVSLDNYLHFSYSVSDGNTTMYVSSAGQFGNNNTVTGNPNSVINNDVQQIVFSGVDLTSGFSTDQQVIQDLINKGKLITD